MMCELISAATMATVFGEGAAALTVLDAIGIVGTITSATGAITSAQAQKDQFAYQSAIERQKAEIRNRQAEDVVDRGEEDARRKKAQIKAIHDRQLVTLAGQGGDVTTGTSVDLLSETKELGKLDEERIRNNAARDASAIRADATNRLADASSAQFASSAINPLLTGTTTLLSGIGQVGAQWYKRRTA